MTHHLGVDLGTTSTAAALARDGRAEPATLDTRSVAIPSVVCLAGDELLVGQAAARRSVGHDDLRCATAVSERGRGIVA